jgi:hypothetical protein
MVKRNVIDRFVQEAPFMIDSRLKQNDKLSLPFDQIDFTYLMAAKSGFDFDNRPGH